MKLNISGDFLLYIRLSIHDVLSIISPSKTMFAENFVANLHSGVIFEKEYKFLLSLLQKMSKTRLQQLMAMSDKLTDETLNLFKNFPVDPDETSGRSAIYAYSGEVYQGLSALSFSLEDLEFAQDHLFILSGLFGILRPLDMIAPYRLEMATALQTKKEKTLYGFWRNKITNGLNEMVAMHENKVLLNLASGEYFKVIDQKKFDFPIYHFEFKEMKNGKLTGNSFTNKRMRGVMANYIIKYKIDHPEDLTTFSQQGFIFSEQHSKEGHYLFVRHE